MQNPNKSKYPEIVIDHSANIGSGSHNNRIMTVEEFYDFMHHTHSISDILDDEGYSPNELAELVHQLQAQVEDLTTRLSQANATITELSGEVQEAKSSVVDVTSDMQNVTNSVQAMNTQLEQLQAKVDEQYDVADWDATTPEREGPDGQIIPDDGYNFTDLDGDNNG